MSVIIDFCLALYPSYNIVGAVIDRPRASNARPYIQIVAASDTFIMHSAFCILHYGR